MNEPRLAIICRTTGKSRALWMHSFSPVNCLLPRYLRSPSMLVSVAAIVNTLEHDALYCNANIWWSQGMGLR